MAGIADQPNSMYLAIGNIVRLITRSMYTDFSPKVLVFNFFTGTFGRGEIIVHRQSNLGNLNGRRTKFKSSAVRVAFSDASDTGGYIVELGPQVAVQGVCSAVSTMESSTMREILADTGLGIVCA